MHRACRDVQELAGARLGHLPPARTELQSHPAAHDVQARLVVPVVVPAGRRSRLGMDDSGPQARSGESLPSAHPRGGISVLPLLLTDHLDGSLALLCSHDAMLNTHRARRGAQARGGRPGPTAPEVAASAVAVAGPAAGGEEVSTITKERSGQRVATPDFDASVDELNEQAWNGDGPQTFADIVATAERVVQETDNEVLTAWLRENAVPLIGQNLLVAAVNTQRDVEARFSTLLAQAETVDAEAFVERMKEEQPGLLRAWLLQQLVPLVAARLKDR
jgi:hypothetical protein